MAWYDDPNDPNKQLSTGGGATPGAGGSSAQAGGQGPSGPAPTPGTGYVNLQSYLDLNGRDGANNAKSLAYGIANKSNDALNKIRYVQNKFAEAVRGSVDKLTNNSNDMQDGQGDRYNRTEESNRDIANTLAYTGPTDFTQTPGYGEAVGAVNQVQAAAEATKTGAGVQASLDDAYKSKGTRHSELDAYLTQMGGADTLKKARDTVGTQNLQGYLGNVQGAGASAQVAMAKDRVNTIAQGHRDAADKQRAERQASINSFNKRIANMKKGWAEAANKDVKQMDYDNNPEDHDGQVVRDMGDGGKYDKYGNRKDL